MPDHGDLKDEKTKRRKSPINVYAQMLNMSQEGLRYYEQKGICKPDRNPATGYRLFDEVDAFAVVTCKKYRKYGLPLDEITGLLHTGAHDQFLERLRLQEVELTKELAEREQVLSAMRRSMERVQCALLSIGRYSVVERPALYWIPTRTNGTVLDTGEQISRISHWNTMIPHPEFIVVWSKEELLGQPGGLIQVGHSLEVERASFLPVGEAQVIPGAKSLFTAKEIESGELLEKTLFTDMLRFAKENGYTVNGGGVARLIRIFMDEQEMHHYLMEFWLPVL